MFYLVQIVSKVVNKMNNARRKRVKEIKDGIKITNNTLKNLQRQLSSILDEEQDAFDNMPEGLQSSYRGMCSEDAIDSMEEASEKLDEVIELLSEIM